MENIDEMFEVPPEEFAQLKTNAEKFRFCYNRLLDNAMLMDHVNFSSKDENISEEALKQGESFFEKAAYIEATEMYNKALSFAPLGSQNVSLCYANRSAVFFNTGLYDICLDNIELALNHHCPDELKPELETRLKECKSRMETPGRKLTQENPKLSYPAKDKNPFIIDGLELVSSDNFTRHIRTKHDLNPGDIVMIDKPYVKHLHDGFEYMMCNNCLQPNFLNLFPCDICTKAMYCSKSCEKEAWNRFHKFECEVLEDDLNPLTLRLTLRAFTLYNDVSKLRELFDSVKDKPVTGFDLDYNNISEEDTLKAVYCLATNADQRCVKETFMRCNILANSWHNLYNNKHMEKILTTKDLEDYFFELLIHYSQLTATNSHELGYVMKTSEEIKIKNYGHYSSTLIGSAIFPTMCLMNHSCAPNIFRSSFSGISWVMVVRHIKAGEQLFDNYGPFHLNQTKDERKAALKEMYFFDCQCEACVKDYPLMKSLESADIPEFAAIKPAFSSILQHDPKCATEFFDESKDFIFKHHDDYPCVEQCAALNVLCKCSEILFGNIPLQLQLMPQSPK